MRIVLLTPGTGHFYCGSCLRDSTLGRGLRARGHDVLLSPLYLPFVLEDGPEESTPGESARNNGADTAVHLGGINLYLQQKLPFLRHLPRFLAERLDRPGLLRWASRKGNLTDASGLGAMTLSMLRGEEGRQVGEVEKLVGWLQSIERPDVVCLSNVMLVGLARRLREALGVPVVCTLQGEAPFLDSLPEPYRGRCWSTLAERARDVEAFIPVSRHYGELMAGRLGLSAERVHVVHNGIDLDGESPAEPRAAGAPPLNSGGAISICSMYRCSWIERRDCRPRRCGDGETRSKAEEDSVGWA